MPTLQDVLDELLGAGETALTLGTGAASSAVGMPYGLYKGITGGGYGTRKGVEQAQREAQAFMERNTYIPRTQSGKQNLSAIAKFMDASKLPPVVPEAVLLSSIPRAAALAQAERLGMSAEKALEVPVKRIYEKGGLPREMLMAMGQNTVSPATVYHGSSQKFPKFDPSKIGTGEGSQSFGYGHYLAEAKPVAEDYAFGFINKKMASQLKSLSESDDVVDKTAAARLFYNDDPAALERFVKNKNPNLSRAEVDKVLSASGEKFKSIKEKSGFVYDVDLPDEQISKMLDYDKPISKQPEYIKQQLLDLIEYEGLPEYLRKDIIEERGLNTGRRVYEELVKRLGSDKAASEALRQASIPGIRYLDQGSRGVGAGTSNFVVFPGAEDMLTIEAINNSPMDLLLRSRPK